MTVMFPLPPLGAGAEEIIEFCQALLPVDGLYAPEIRIAWDSQGVVSVEAVYLGADADAIVIDREAGEAFASKRVWKLGTEGVMPGRIGP